MSDQDPIVPKPFVLRVEISPEQAASVIPLFEGLREDAPRPVAQPIAEDTHPIAEYTQPITEEAVDVRVLELRQRESDLEQREAAFEADVLFREDRIERWRTELEELEQTLDRRERDIVSYVDQLQGAISGDDAWWSRPAGGDGGVRP